MKKLKVASPKWAGYTGPLGNVAFKDGVSVDFLPRIVRDRLAASMEFVEVDEDGNEQPAGVAHRLVEDSTLRAPILEPLVRQTEEDKKKEAVSSALAANRAPDILSREELEAIASKGGIKALRETAEKWAVKHRSIPVLIELILAEQEKFVAARNKRLADAAAAEVVRLNGEAPADKEVAAPETPNTDDKKSDEVNAAEAKTDESEQGDLLAGLEGADLAAASGDLSAALNEQEKLEPETHTPAEPETHTPAESGAEPEAASEPEAPAEGEPPAETTEAGKADEAPDAPTDATE